jgi:hypothetical protein
MKDKRAFRKSIAAGLFLLCLIAPPVEGAVASAKLSEGPTPPSPGNSGQWQQQQQSQQFQQQQAQLQQLQQQLRDLQRRQAIVNTANGNVRNLENTRDSLNNAIGAIGNILQEKMARDAAREAAKEAQREHDDLQRQIDEGEEQIRKMQEQIASQSSQQPLPVPIPTVGLPPEGPPPTTPSQERELINYTPPQSLQELIQSPASWSQQTSDTGDNPAGTAGNAGSARNTGNLADPPDEALGADQAAQKASRSKWGGDYLENQILDGLQGKEVDPLRSGFQKGIDTAVDRTALETYSQQVYHKSYDQLELDEEMAADMDVKWNLDSVRSAIRDLDPRVMIYKRARSMINSLDKSLNRFGNEMNAVEKDLGQ